MPPKKKQRTGFNWKEEIEPALLAGHLDSDSFTSFCKAKLSRNDDAVLKLLREFDKHKDTCVFCKVAFHPHFPGECVTYHQVDESTKKKERNSQGKDVDDRCAFFGTCKLCGETVSGSGTFDDDEPDEWQGDDGAVCYSGPHCNSYPEGYCEEGESEEPEDD
eukprot:TRINITY_DN13440_c0_g1_i1.p1 TRINITY_DN13440_c0_g1~~TRINITY_DN13440_c0_g1_i1.p1  ORF type:complete len:162 (+),score=46.51 TRINITY_DN13440_c0_g1_i1:27-512(+)